MKIMTTMVAVGSAIRRVDTIRFKGGLWLVPEWLDMPDEKLTRPARIIRIDLLRLEKVNRSVPGIDADYVLSDPIPKEIFDGTQLPGEPQFVVVKNPQILLRLDRDKLN